MAQEELTKVYIDLPNNPHTGGEALWARALGDDLYELQNSPFYAYGLNFLDVVYAVSRSPEQKPSVLRVVRRSGHQTIWVTFTDDADGEARSERLKSLNQWRGFYENADGTSFAIDVEPEGDCEAVLRQLGRWREQAILTFHSGVQGGFEPRSA
jgi:hypothetical protein